MESLIRDLVMDYFLINNLFSDKQYGFIKGRSTVLQLLKLSDDWTRCLDENEEVDIICTDFEKAFDKVPHQRLISKLQAYGGNELSSIGLEHFLRLGFKLLELMELIPNKKGFSVEYHRVGLWRKSQDDN